MIVTRTTFDSYLVSLKARQKISLDTETDGLRPYHGDRLFSIILCSGGEPLYFNFIHYADIVPEHVLTAGHLATLRDDLFSDPTKIWAIHNASFDLSILAVEGIELAGTVHCTQSIARVEYNQHWEYNLDACAGRIGHKKDSRVDDYITENGLTSKTRIPGRKTAKTNKHFDRVPFDLIVPYGCQDSAVGFHLFDHQETTLRTQSDLMPAGKPTPWQVMENERRLTKTVHRMHHRGVRVDLPYVGRALAFERDKLEKSTRQFRVESGRPYLGSNKLFQEVFASEKDKWVWGEPTEKKGEINPTFESEVLETFTNPVAKTVLSIRETQSKVNFYSAFEYYADRDGIIHPHFNQAGADTGRFSSSEPNLQNLTAENILICRTCQEGYETVVTACRCGSTDLESPEFLTRRAFIPRDGFIFIMPDYDQMEYRMMFDAACKMVGYETPLVKEILAGKDPHQATADTVTASGYPLTRKRAKNGNFALLYGSGDATLASTIGASVQEAKNLREMILSAAPEIAVFINAIKATSRSRGFIFNWLGRRLYCPDPRFAYKMPNHYIQGGTADVNKVALNRIDEYLLDKKSKLVLTIHDEDPVEVHESEAHVVPQKVKELMESVYPWTYLPLTAGMEWSAKSLADKVKGFPT